MSPLGFDIGWGELLIILIVALLVVGPEKLPSYARKTARFVRNFQKITTGLTSQITKAINLDEEDDKASDLKKDLIAVKKSLEKDVAELKATLDGQAKAISDTMETGTKEAAASLEKGAREISDTLSTQAGELKQTFDAQAAAVSQTVESGMKETADNLEKSASEVSTAVNDGNMASISPPTDEPFTTPVSASEPSYMPTNEAEAS